MVVQPTDAIPASELKSIASCLLGTGGPSKGLVISRDATKCCSTLMHREVQACPQNSSIKV